MLYTKFSNYQVQLEKKEPPSSLQKAAAIIFASLVTSSYCLEDAAQYLNAYDTATNKINHPPINQSPIHDFLTTHILPLWMALTSLELYAYIEKTYDLFTRTIQNTPQRISTARTYATVNCCGFFRAHPKDAADSIQTIPQLVII